jgi:hypothetical protein
MTPHSIFTVLLFAALGLSTAIDGIFAIGEQFFVRRGGGHAE